MKVAVFDNETDKSEYLQIIEVHKALNTCLTYPFCNVFSDIELEELNGMFEHITQVVKQSKN